MEQVQMDYRKMDIWKVNEFKFLNEEVEELTRRWSQNLVNVKSRSYLKQKIFEYCFWCIKDYLLYIQFFIWAWSYIVYLCYIYPQTRVSSFPGLISVVRVNKYRTTDVTRVLKAPGAELHQNTCDEVNKQISMNKFRVYTSTDTCFVLPMTHQCGSG